MKYFLKDTKSASKPWKRVLLILALISVFSYLAFMGAYYATSSSSFCGTCHELKPYYLSWKDSPHNDVNCMYCHEFRGFLGKLNSKARGLNYLYQHITGQYTITTQGVVFEQNCTACHLGDYWNYPQTRRLDMKHYEFLKADKSCMQCHRDAGHKVNNFSQENFRK